MLIAREYSNFNHFIFQLLSGQKCVLLILFVILKCRYDLVQADLAVANFNELSVINLRRLFANKGSTFMERQKQIVEKVPPKRKLTIDTIF